MKIVLKNKLKKNSSSLNIIVKAIRNNPIMDKDMEKNLMIIILILVLLSKEVVIILIITRMG